MALRRLMHCTPDTLAASQLRFTHDLSMLWKWFPSVQFVVSCSICVRIFFDSFIQHSRWCFLRDASSLMNEWMDGSSLTVYLFINVMIMISMCTILWYRSICVRIFFDSFIQHSICCLNVLLAPSLRLTYDYQCEYEYQSMLWWWMLVVSCYDDDFHVYNFVVSCSICVRIFFDSFIQHSRCCLNVLLAPSLRLTYDYQCEYEYQSMLWWWMLVVSCYDDDFHVYNFVVSCSICVRIFFDSFIQHSRCCLNVLLAPSFMMMNVCGIVLWWWFPCVQFCGIV